MGKILFKRGPKERLPVLDLGEPAVTNDSGELYIGGPQGNILVNKPPLYGPTTNSGNAYSIALPTITAMDQLIGRPVRAKINASSTGAITLNISSLGAQSCKNADGTDVTDVNSGGVYTFVWDGTNFIAQGKGGISATDKENLVNTIGSPSTTAETVAQLTGDIQTQKNTMASRLTSAGITAAGTEALAALVSKIPNVAGKKSASGVTNGTVYQEGDTYYQVLEITGLDFTPGIIVAVGNSAPKYFAQYNFLPGYIPYNGSYQVGLSGIAAYAETRHNQGVNGVYASAGAFKILIYMPDNITTPIPFKWIAVE